jgi:hypothetical protein
MYNSLLFRVHLLFEQMSKLNGLPFPMACQEVLETNILNRTEVDNTDMHQYHSIDYFWHGPVELCSKLAHS